MSFLEILVLSVASLMFLFAIGVFFYKTFTMNKEEIKQMLKKPTSIFSAITLLFVMIDFFTEDFFYDFFFIPLITTPIAVILVSRALTSFVARWKMKKLAWLLTIFFGIGSFCIFIILIVLLVPDYPRLNRYTGYQQLAFAYSMIILGGIVLILSLILNIVEKVRVK
jgi:hypothetical protein